MREQKQIVIDIDSDGNCSIDGQHFQGPECSYFINEVQKALGKQTSIKNKPEYKQHRIISRKNTQRAGR